MHDHEFEGDFGGSHGWRGHRARRGDMVPIILRALLNKPMHGYEVISHLEEISHGLWRPSAGSIYPNLQLLEERGLVKSTEKDGKKIYTLTDEGRKAAEKVDETFKAHWEHHEHAEHYKDLRRIVKEIFGLFRQIDANGSEETYDQVKQILEEARDRLAKIADQE